MEGPGNDLKKAVAHAEPLLRAITDEQASAHPPPGKWCPKEIIGHLLDSANNNLGRFVRLQATDHLLFEPYAQEDWVRAQAHASADWSELVDLWAQYNRHIARVWTWCQMPRASTRARSIGRWVPHTHCCPMTASPPWTG